MSSNKRKRTKVVYPLPGIFPFLDSIFQANDPSVLIDQETTSTIQLNSNMFNDVKEHEFLVIRSCYPALFQFCESALAVEEGESPHLKRYAIITGTAGTGKTYFGVYAAMRWFAAGQIVRLWIAESELYMFARELQEHDPVKEVMERSQLTNGDEIWFHYSYSVGKQSDLEDQIAKRCLRMDLPPIYTIRDPGELPTISKVQSPGPVLYTISSDHHALLRALLSKSPRADAAVRRFSPLWDHQEFLNGSIVHTYAEKIKAKQKYAIAPDKRHFNEEIYRYRLYLDEGYLRFGGSARRVFKFIDYASSYFATRAFDSVGDSLKAVKGLSDEQD